MLRISPKERDLARHALGLPNDRRRSYRNRFVLAPGGIDFNVWKRLCDRGLAFSHPLGRSGSGSICFRASRALAEAVISPGESIDQDDLLARERDL